MNAFRAFLRLCTTFIIWNLKGINIKLAKLYAMNVLEYNFCIWGQYLCTLCTYYAFICLHIINYVLLYLSRYHPCVISTHKLVISVTYSYCVSGSIYSTYSTTYPLRLHMKDNDFWSRYTSVFEMSVCIVWCDSINMTRRRNIVGISFFQNVSLLWRLGKYDWVT